MRQRHHGRWSWMRIGAAGALAAASVLAPFEADAAEAETPQLLAKSSSFTELTLEQLSNIEVTSVSRRTEHLADAAASIYVITAEDIRRSGATSLPEALRLAPVLQVARADANQYAITARGFNSVLANKMLVMIDGRTVYSPLFSGVFWEAQDLLLGDVERIEIIAGPGGTLWGTNAVNGVIHVITRPAADTQGSLGGVMIGNLVRSAGTRYGGLVGAGHYRVYSKVVDIDHTELANETSVDDASTRFQSGFRADWANDSGGVTVQGDGYFGDIHAAPANRKISGVNLQARWSRHSANGAGMRLQAYYDYVKRDQPGAIRDWLHTYDLEFQQSLQPSPRHRILWGAGFRYQPDHVVNLVPAALAFLPADRRLKYGSLFAQDEIGLLQTLDLIVGLKAERNDFTGVEYLPNARLAWKPHSGQLLWGEVSRAVRAPSRIDREFFIPGNPPHFILDGGPNFRSEISDVAEIGFRGQPVVALSYSITAYRHEHDRLRSFEPNPSGPRFENRFEGHTQGVEAWASYRVNTYWKLTGGGVRQSVELRPKAGSLDPTGGTSLGNDPKYWWRVRSSFDLGTHYEVDVAVRRSGALPSGPVPAYTAVDARLAWRSAGNTTVALTGQNLLDAEHPEWGAPASRAELERSIQLRLGWRL